MAKKEENSSSAGKFDFVTPVLVVVLLITAIASFATDPPILFFIIMIAIAFVTVAVSALRNTILFKIGLRNMYRRKGYSVIVVLGLMIGTVIISSSLILGDTMNNMISSAVYKSFDQTDIIIYGENVDGSQTYISESSYSELRAEIMKVDNVEGVTGEINERVAIYDTNSQLSEPTMTFIGYNTTSAEFGYIHSGGKRVSFELPAGQIYLNKNGAKALDAKTGDLVKIYTRTGPQNLTIAAIVDSSGRGGALDSYIFAPLENAQALFNVPHSVNEVKITNKGDVKGGEQYCKAVIKDLEPLLKTSKYDLNQMTFNKVTMANDPAQLQKFKENTYGNVPADFEMSSIMDPKFYIYDQYLNSSDELIMLANWTDMSTFGLLAADLSDSPYVYGVTPELDV